jgi:hypothetical protein
VRKETFLEALHRMARATPFRPFTVELVNRARLIARHPEAIVVEQDLAVFTETDGTTQLFDAASVARLVTQAIPPHAE